MNIHQCITSVYSGVLLPQARSFKRKGFFRKQWTLGRGFDLGEVQKYSENPILLQEISIPHRGQKIPAEELERLKTLALEILNAEAAPYGWQFHALPTYDERQETLDQITDEAHRLVMQECLRVIDRVSDNWHDTMLDLGAKGRRSVYLTMPITFTVFAIQVK